ncbi:ABC transporter permease [Bradyrhizobium sp.]|uniref:ABC transporter permease n=1 Tax=Bradyrhizobium sp. TaxID=376 RepID=UPI0023A0AA39|nr:ABC transporter permease [Bradyrhizobium sp.]MDE2378247.1 ABC transporter permease [Bradyrhizobium sp.]
MRMTDLARLSAASLTAAPVRSCLTMLGIFIGVAAITSMAAIGAGAKSKVSEQIRSFGANVIMVNATAGNRAGMDHARRPLSLNDAAAIAELSSVRLAAASVAGQARLVRGGLNWATTVNGTTHDHFEIRQWRLAGGRFFTEQEEKDAGQVVVLGSLVARKLFEGTEPVGQVIRILGAPLKVIGVLAEKGTSGADSQDDVAFVPMATAKNRLIGSAGGDRNAVNYILASAASSAVIGDATEDIESLMRQRQHVVNDEDKGFRVATAASIVAAQEASTRTVSMLLAAVACVSLAVGGIGIMNIMLVSVTERTREIGLRLAIGARPRDIRTQFVIEAAALCTGGGVVGVAMGFAVASLAARSAGWPVVLDPATAIGAVLFSGLVGILFGYYPAKRAASLDPVAALRGD